MRKILLFMTLGCSILLGACSDVEVGYLVSEHAAYTQDTLHLYNIEYRLEELTNILNEFHEKTGPLLEEKVELSELKQEKQWDFDDYEIAPVKEQLASCTDAETCKKLQALLDELNAQREVMRKEISNLDDQIWNLQQQVNQIAEGLGFSSEKELTNQVDKLKNTIEYEIPWVTSPIEGVLGTEPLVYSIENVKNENAANAELFRKSLTIMGGGRMYVEQNLEAPAGRYVVSIRLENKGQRAILEDAFTFIVGE